MTNLTILKYFCTGKSLMSPSHQVIQFTLVLLNHSIVIITCLCTKVLSCENLCTNQFINRLHHCTELVNNYCSVFSMILSDPFHLMCILSLNAAKFTLIFWNINGFIFSNDAKLNMYLYMFEYSKWW